MIHTEAKLNPMLLLTDRLRTEALFLKNLRTAQFTKEDFEDALRNIAYKYISYSEDVCRTSMLREHLRNEGLTLMNIRVDDMSYEEVDRMIFMHGEKMIHFSDMAHQLYKESEFIKLESGSKGG